MSEKPIAEVKETCVGPKLLVCDVQVCTWFGTTHNEKAHELAAQVNAAWNTRPTHDALVEALKALVDWYPPPRTKGQHAALDNANAVLKAAGEL